MENFVRMNQMICNHQSFKVFSELQEVNYPLAKDQWASQPTRTA